MPVWDICVMIGPECNCSTSWHKLRRHRSQPRSLVGGDRESIKDEEEVDWSPRSVFPLCAEIIPQFDVSAKLISSPLATNLVSNIPKPPRRRSPQFRSGLSFCQHICACNSSRRVPSQTRLTDSRNTPVNIVATNALSIPFRYTLRWLWSSSVFTGRYAGTRRCSEGQSAGF